MDSTASPHNCADQAELGDTTEQTPAMHILPEDALALVFYEILWSLAPYQRCLSPPVLSPSHVCRLWRRAAVVNKRLWTYIPTCSPELASLFLERSQPIDVAVYLTWEFCSSTYHHHAVYKEIMRHIGRIRLLVNWGWEDPGHTPSDFTDAPALEVLGTHRRNLAQSTLAQLTSYTHLRSLTLSHVEDMIFTKPLVCPSITSVCLYHSTLNSSAFHNFMLSVPCLQDLLLFRSAFDDEGQSQTSVINIPPLLRRVQIVGSNSSILHLLDIFLLPSRTALSAHFIDDMDNEHNDLKDLGPPSPDMPVTIWITHHNGKTRMPAPRMVLMPHEMNGFSRLLASLDENDTLFIISSPSLESLEFFFQDQGMGDFEQRQARAPISLTIYHSSPHFMAGLVHLCLYSLVRIPKHVTELRLEGSLRMRVLRSILTFLATSSGNTNMPALKRLHIRGSEARLHHRSLSHLLAAVKEAWPELEINSAVEHPVSDEDNGDSISGDDEMSENSSLEDFLSETDGDEDVDGHHM
ncbi:hypothetical protein PENSPDRAFT_128990 [Peniophora sp. CONT]|nr:hypothetical protein PENSPDRAFT_128990 [Peniophora sp. CONT]